MARAAAKLKEDYKVELEQDYRKVVDTTDAFVRLHPHLVKDESLALMEKHGWWLKEAHRHANHGYYGAGELTLFSMGFNRLHLGDDEIGRAERKLEEMVFRKRFMQLYYKVEGRSNQLDLFPSRAHMGIPALLDGTYSGIIGDLKKIMRDAGTDGRVDSGTDVLLPRDIMKMNYPFSHLRGISGLPPRPSELRVLFDWEMSFDDCFDFEYVLSLKYPKKGRIKKEVKNYYVMHTGSRSRMENWVLDLTQYNHRLRVLTTFNERGRIDFATQHGNMHKKFWIYKAQKAFEHFGGRHPMVHDPRELYNSARRAIRRTNSHLLRLSNELGAEYHTFPSKINP